MKFNQIIIFSLGLISSTVSATPSTAIGLNDNNIGTAVTTNITSRNAPTLYHMNMTNRHPALGLPVNRASSTNSIGGSRLGSGTNLDLELDAQNAKISLDQFEQSLGMKFEKTLANLKTMGNISRNPWPGDYWPTYQDSVNKVVEGETMSPVAKYATARSADPVLAENTLSAQVGIDSFSFYQSCTQNSDCQQAECAKRRGATTGYCIPSWFGICHAWAPAAINEVEPKCNVTVNNVQFTVNDIKGLLSLMYHNSQFDTLFAGDRCEDNQPVVDELGRAAQTQCRDSHPEIFHLILTNVLGAQSRSFVVDVDGASQVWNHPAHSYSYTYTNVTATDAANLISPALNGQYALNTNAASFAHVKTNFQYVVESSISPFALSTPQMIGYYLKAKNYEYILELDQNGQIIGGEWIGDSKLNHPDFMWMATSRPQPNTAVAGIEFSFVNQLLEQSQTGC